MTKLNPTEIGKVALRNGFPRDESKLRLCIAIAMAESRGDTNVKNPKSGATGLWQILPSAHPEYDVARLTDPDYNAQAMIKISTQGTNWNPWEAYTDGSYRLFFEAVSIPAKDALRNDPGVLDTIGNIGSTVTDSVGNTIDTAKDVAGFIAAIASTLKKLTDLDNIKRVLKVLTGIVIILAALGVLNRDLIGDIAQVATPAGRAVAAVK